jgi:DNA-binding transcriptional LysR family regulator
MQDATNLNRLAYFVAVIDAGSFTRAAEYLGITKAVVSQQVARLEQEVGTTLLMRTTRRLQPTEAGRMFHARCVSILREAEDALAELAQARSEPKGLLRITAPYDYGTSVIVPVVTAFTARYRDCKVELNLSDKMVDLVADNMDLAIRVGWLDRLKPAGQADRLVSAISGRPASACQPRIADLDGLAEFARPALCCQQRAARTLGVEVHARRSGDD